MTNSASSFEYPIIANAEKSRYDGTVRLAPPHSFSQESILELLNKNTVNPNNPDEIFTGSFVFSENDVFSGEYGKLPFPTEISQFIETLSKAGEAN